MSAGAEQRPAFRAAARLGDIVAVAGTVGRDENGNLVRGVERQFEYAMRRVAAALAEFGLGRDDIGRLRIFLTDVADWPSVRELGDEMFPNGWPPCTVVEVIALVEPEMLVEIEADAARNTSC